MKSRRICLSQSDSLHSAQRPSPTPFHAAARGWVSLFLMEAVQVAIDGQADQHALVPAESAILLSRTHCFKLSQVWFLYLHHSATGIPSHSSLQSGPSCGLGAAIGTMKFQHGFLTLRRNPYPRSSHSEGRMPVIYVLCIKISLFWKFNICGVIQNEAFFGFVSCRIYF